MQTKNTQTLVLVLSLFVLISIVVGCSLPIANNTTSQTNDQSEVIIGTALSSNITSNRTLAEGVYTVTANINVTAALVIKPGVTLLFKPDTSLTIDPSGSISAVGSADKMIYFKSAKAITGKDDYLGITVDGNTSVFQYCSFQHAQRALYATRRNIRVDNCFFENNVEAFDAGYATEVTLTSTSFKNNTVPLWIGEFASLDDSNTFSGNTYQRIQLWGGRITKENTSTVLWGETEVPFYIGATADIGVDTPMNVDVSDGTTLKLNPGVKIDFSAGSGMTVSGIINATGTATNKIMFSSGKTSKYKEDWEGLDIKATGSAFEHCVFEYANTALSLNGNITDQGHCTVNNSAFNNNVTGLDYSSTSNWAPPGTNTYSGNTTDTVGH